MHPRLHVLLTHAGIVPELAATLAAYVIEPVPGSIDVTELDGATDTQLALLSAIVAAAHYRQYGTALPPLLASVSAGQTSLSDYDNGRFWHLKGFAALHLDEALYSATRALNRSLSFLHGDNSARTRAYRARVYDTFGQLLQRQGLLSEARREFELALQHRDPADAEGTALTLGNLGRLCMELGDFASAAEYLGRDLNIVTHHIPHRTELRTQLLSHLGTCALGRGGLTAARNYFQQSKRLAQADGNAHGLAFAALGLGQRAVRCGKMVTAQRQVHEAQRQLTAAPLPDSVANGVRGLLSQLMADIYLAQQRPEAAIAAFHEAQQYFAHATDVSRIEQAHLLYGLARASVQQGEGAHASLYLQQALQVLEPTTAEQLRREIEGTLRSHSRESWLFHTAGRFLGPREQTEELLEEAGRGGFRGEEQEVVILFSDIRGFTSLADGLSPVDLITFLNDYLGHMTRCVEARGGMVDKFIGDAVMAVFSLPTPHPDDADRAVQAALMMRDELERFNRTLPPEIPALAIGLGLHTGPVVAGLIGSPQKRSYTVIGDAVNTASRLESMTKHLGASILVSAEVIQRLAHPEHFLLRRLGTYSPKGRHTPVTVVDILGENDGSHLARALAQEIAAVDVALALFTQGQFCQAKQAFETLAQRAAATEAHTRSHGYRYLMDIADGYSQHPVPPDWDGTIVMLDK